MLVNLGRLYDLQRFYRLLEGHEHRLGGKRKLGNCNGRMAWPQRGVYFFFEPEEIRSDSGTGLRVVRVGTHALKEGSRTTLWTRMSQHRGVSRTGGGNHRGSVFRQHVGTAIMAQNPTLPCSTWGEGRTAKREIRDQEHELEVQASQVIGAMPFLWLGVEDPAGSESFRGYIERNSIALLSNYCKPALDPPSEAWLGTSCKAERVRASGLWNHRHVDELYSPDFLDVLERLVSSGVTSSLRQTADQEGA